VHKVGVIPSAPWQEYRRVLGSTFEPRRGLPKVATGESPWRMIFIIWRIDPGGVDQFPNRTHILGRPLQGPDRFHKGLVTVGCHPRLLLGRPSGATTAREHAPSYLGSSLLWASLGARYCYPVDGVRCYQTSSTVHHHIPPAMTLSAGRGMPAVSGDGSGEPLFVRRVFPGKFS
jgi:hypothetical protein